MCIAYVLFLQGMGGQFGYWGLYLDSRFGEGECSESCTTFRNYKMLASKARFHIQNVEIWSVGDPPPTDEEKVYLNFSSIVVF